VESKMEKSKLEKFSITFSMQLEKGIDELLAELYFDEKYEGYVGITWETKIKNKEFQLDLSSEKLTHPPIKRKPRTNYYHIVQDKGVKKI
jgi:hypothetical protein